MTSSKQSKSEKEPPNGLISKSFSVMSSLPVRRDISASFSPKPETKYADHKKNSSLNTGGSSTPVDISDKKHLLSPDSSHSSDSGSRKGKKKKRRKERDVEESREGSSSRSDSSFKKKKKNKKNKEERKKLLRKINESDSDGGSHYKTKKHKRSRSLSSSSNSSDSGSSDVSYEWVEKTCETVPHKGKPKKEACVQSWNHHIKDDLAPRKDETRERKAGWDGARESKVARHFSGSSQSYKSQVLSWDGGKSQLDQDLDVERAAVKRGWADDYNEEIDSGKVKKVKKHSPDPGFSVDNPFQDYQSQKQKYQTSSWSQDHSYHHHHDHHYHKKTSIRPSWHGYKNYHSKEKRGYKVFD